MGKAELAREIKARIKQSGDEFYGQSAKMTAEARDALALQIAVLWRHLARLSHRA